MTISCCHDDVQRSFPNFFDRAPGLARSAILKFESTFSPNLILRACESFDFWVFRHESNQGLKTCENIEIRIDSHTLRSRATSRGVSKDGRASGYCVHPSRCLLRKLLRMRSVANGASPFSDSNVKQQIHVGISRHDMARGLRIVVPRNNEGAGNAGCALHPRSRVQSCAKKNAHEHTGSAEAIRHSLRNGLTAYSALSPEYRAFLPPSPPGNWHSGPVGLSHLR